MELEHYIVTVHNFEDIESFYTDMETHSLSIDGSVPARACECINRRPTSRNTSYFLTLEEAYKLKQDPRVKDVEPHPELRGISAGTCEITQTSNAFNKSVNSNSLYLNWALLRCTEGLSRENWGSDGNTTVAGTVRLAQTGKGVDVVVVDADGFLPNHPEFSDGNNGSRAKYYNWFQHAGAVGDSANIDATYVNGTNEYHPIHVMGSVGGNTQGWARDANLYNIYYDAGNPGDFSYVYNYVKEFHLAKTVDPITGLRRPTICNNSWGQSIFPSQWSFSNITAVTYRGTRYVPGNIATNFTGVSGVFSSSALSASLVKLETGGNSIVTDNVNATVTEIPSNLLGGFPLPSSVTPTVGNNDDGYWAISLPFNINFFGTSYDTIYIGTNMYVTFGGGALAYSNLGPNNPALPKIMWCAGDRSIQRIYYGIEGTAPNRTYRIVIEGNTTFVGQLGTPAMVAEYVLYESTPNRIDLQAGLNQAKTTSNSTFTTAQLNAWGFIAGKRIPARVAALDADLEDAIKAGIITVGASGNGYWKHDVPGGPDWNNSFEMANLYPSSVLFPYYYMRGSSPTANDNTSDGGYDLPNICVGAVDVNVIDQKAYYSDCGPGTDIWAPGTAIISSWNSSNATTFVPYPTNSNYNLAKISGTSMASPQVCGVLACALELNPHWNQQQAKNYILGIAKRSQLVDGGGGPTDIRDLQGAPNLFLFYKKERPSTGLTVPKADQGVRPITGSVYPRPKIHRYP